MQAFVNSRLGLQETAAAPARVRRAPAAPPKREGDLWASVTVLAEHATSPSLQCKNCGEKFCGGATRIREHICNKCNCETSAFLDLKQKCLAETEADVVTKKQKVAEKEVDEASEEKPAVVKSETKKHIQQGMAVAVKAARERGHVGRTCRRSCDTDGNGSRAMHGLYL
jgi:hypothetical protein